MTKYRLGTFLLSNLFFIPFAYSSITTFAPNVQAEAEILIDAPAEQVWAILAEDFAGIGKWSSGVAHSQGFGEPIGESPHSIRACEITAAGFDDTKEVILEYDASSHLLRYSLFDGLPGFVKDAVNQWQLEEKGGQTLLRGRTEMRATGVMGFTMKGIMKNATRKALESMCEELKYFVENGTPHPDKLASEEKLALKDQRKRKQVSSFEVSYDIAASAAAIWKVIADDFAQVHQSNPLSPKSHFLEGFDQVEEGAKRIMYMSENEKNYFVDKLVELNREAYQLTIEIDEAQGFPIQEGYTWLNMNLDERSPESTRLTLRFNYLTKPTFLKGLARGGLRKNFQEYAYAIDHHVRTGEVITAENWKTIRRSYK